jgi:amino acid permease
MRSFTDIIGFALGKNGERIVTCLFFMEFALWMYVYISGVDAPHTYPSSHSGAVPAKSKANLAGSHW